MLTAMNARDLTQQHLHQMYVVEGISSGVIGDRLGLCGATIRKYLRKFGIGVNQKDGKLHDPFKCNHHTFGAWSHEMAYLLGYVVADGGIRPNKSNELKFKSIDLGLMETNHTRETTCDACRFIRVHNPAKYVKMRINHNKENENEVG